jgi:hypothetical protein
LGLRHGHLVYAKGEADAARHAVRRSGIEIHCHALELAAEPAVLLTQASKLADAAESPRLAQCLADATVVIEQIPANAPAAVKLAQAWNGFHTLRMVSVILDAEAVPRRDAFALAEGWCTQALELLADDLGLQLIRRYSPGHVAGPRHRAEVTRAGQVELMLATDSDIDVIAAQIASLADVIKNALMTVTDDEAALPQLRSSARVARRLAEQIWSHYGGDGGGW